VLDLKRVTLALLAVSLLALQMFAKVAGSTGSEGVGYLASIDRIGDGFTVLVLEDGHTFALPDYVIGPDAEEGSVLQIRVFLDSAATDACKEASLLTIEELVGVSR